MTPQTDPDNGFVRVAEIEVDAVRPSRSGFVLAGRGSDRAEYILEVMLEMPMDRQTRSVLGELLSHSEWRLSRRVAPSFRRARSAVKRDSQA